MILCLPCIRSILCVAILNTLETIAHRQICPRVCHMCFISLIFSHIYTNNTQTNKNFQFLCRLLHTSLNITIYFESQPKKLLPVNHKFLHEFCPYLCVAIFADIKLIGINHNDEIKLLDDSEGFLHHQIINLLEINQTCVVVCFHF